MRAVSFSLLADGWARIVGSASRSSSPRTPNVPARSSSAWSTSAVAAASANARWHGSTETRR